MSDVFSKSKRSDVMSKITSKNTKPEITVRKFLFSKGLRYRTNDKRFPGRPDIVLPKHKVIVFVHGCFWHGHSPCKIARLPGTRTIYWSNKITTNQKRDKQNSAFLRRNGWHVITVWECHLERKAQREKRLERLLKQISRQ